MTLARDERIGIAIAMLVASAAIATYVYRQARTARPSAPPTDPVHEIRNDQAARDGYAEILQQAFAIEGNAASVTADRTTLRVRWDMCSRQMLQRLLHDDQNLQVKHVREVSGLSVKRLRSHGFAQVTCDDGRKGLPPASASL